MINSVRVCILLTLFLAPLAIATPSLGYEQIKFLLFLLLTSFTGLVWLVYLIKEKVTLKLDKLDNLGLGFVIILAITSISGLDPQVSLIGKPPYFQGLILYSYLFLFALIVKSSKISLKEVSVVLSFATFIVSLLALAQGSQLYLLHQNIPNYAGRVVSTFGQPNLYAGFLVLSLPFIFQTRWGKIIFPVITAAIVLSFSRTAILILCGWLIFQLISRLHWSKLKFSLVTLPCLVAGFLMAAYFSTGLIQDEIIVPQTSLWLKVNAPEKRILIWPIVGEFILNKPILGYGLENLDLLFMRYEKKHEQRSPAYYGIKNLNIDRSHNYVLDLLVFSGIVGLVCWLALVGLLLERIRGALLGSLLVYLIWSLFQTQSIIHLMLFWLIMGLSGNQVLTTKEVISKT